MRARRGAPPLDEATSRAESGARRCLAAHAGRARPAGLSRRSSHDSGFGFAERLWAKPASSSWLEAVGSGSDGGFAIPACVHPACANAPRSLRPEAVVSAAVSGRPPVTAQRPCRAGRSLADQLSNVLRQRRRSPRAGVGSGGDCSRRQHVLEEFAREASFDLRDVLRRAAATISPPASPPSARGRRSSRPADHFEVVLDDDHRVAVVDEALQRLEQLLDVGEVQAGRRLVEDVERLARRPLRQLAASLTRWASPPESVVAGWPSLT